MNPRRNQSSSARRSSESGILLSDDLIFNSRIVGTAQTLGLRLATVRSADVLLESARREPPSCVIIDLANPGLNIAQLVNGLRDLNRTTRIVAYGPHVDAEALHAARVAGCDAVLPRSKFIENLADALPGWFSAD